MKENQKLFLKTLFICTLVLSCTKNDVRKISTSNQLTKTNQTITLNEVNFETNEDKIVTPKIETPNVKIIKESYNLAKLSIKNKIDEIDVSNIYNHNKEITTKVQKKELNKLQKTFEETEIKDIEQTNKTSSEKSVGANDEEIAKKQDENNLLAINAALSMLSKDSKNNFLNSRKDNTLTTINPFSKNVFKVGVLIPMSGKNKSIGSDIMMGIETAFFSEDFYNSEIIFFDSMDIPDEFYNLLINKNLDLLIGPVFSDKLKEIYQTVDHIKIPVLSFSNNKKLKNKNVWLLGKMQEDEIEHIIDFGIKTGINKFAIIGENTEYSKTLIFTAKNILLKKGIGLDIIIFEEETLNNRVKLRDKIKKISGWKKEHKNKLILPKPIYDGILFTGSNEFILKLAPLLSYYDLNSERVTYLGNSKFKSSQLVRELSLQGTFFSSNNEPNIDEFTSEWRDNWGLNPSYFSILAYDLALFAKKLSLEEDLLNFITRAQGHKWFTGEVFLTEDGLNKRKQVVNLIENKQSSTIYFD
tara:strand:+ start:300 stop:1880 length:1581 start_codon:yes stop_codon:yes gene_type:complete